jgi:preprotein translocase YajC subunit
MDPFIIIMLVGMLALMFFTQSRARKQAAKQNEFRSSLQPGQRVMTQGGLVGTIVSVNDADETVILQSAGSTCEYKRAGIAKTLDPAVGVAAVPGSLGTLGNLGTLGSLGTLGNLGAGQPVAAAPAVVEPAYGAMIDPAVVVETAPVAGEAFVVEEGANELDDFAILDSITREYQESQNQLGNSGEIS